MHLYLNGLLQGIGFRPFIYRLAKIHSLTGWVANDGDAVSLEIEGDKQSLQNFLNQLQNQIPACGYITQINQTSISPIKQSDFYFAPSITTNKTNSFICPDITVCKDCLNELFDKSNKRYLHPFISCCHCGSRYSIISALPYDRMNTSLNNFEMCSDCEKQYYNPMDRRFFAQTIACHHCGPQLSFCDNKGNTLYHKKAALDIAIYELKAGKIIALKGIGGFQLLVDACNEMAIKHLRERKQRISKPFAIMVANTAQARYFCEVSELEDNLLNSPTAPIVLLKKLTAISPLAVNIAPKQQLLGVMLPSSPLHHLLLSILKTPLIATSGNRHDEPICTTNKQALLNLADIADGFLVHDRDILRPLDDSIVRVIADIPTVLRRARGFVPTPIHLQQRIPAMLAVGGQQKNTVAIAQDKHIIISQHIGDLNTLASMQQHEKTIADLNHLYGFAAQQVICDKHNDYISSQYAQRLNLPLEKVQHHHAHILSCMAEHHLKPPVLGVAWDGTGLGNNNALWGGEFLHVHTQGFNHIAQLRPFPLVGGVQAIKEPRRALLGLLFAWQGENIFNHETYKDLLNSFTQCELKILRSLLIKQINCPLTSSIGRLFDALASLLNLCHISEFEGQAAMALEQCAMNETLHDYYEMKIINSEPFMIDWQNLLMGILQDLKQLSKTQIAAKIHHSLANSIFIIAQKTQLKHLVLSGGCFQNAYLVQAIINHELAKNYTIIRHQNIPPNDGGLALGQIYKQVLQIE